MKTKHILFSLLVMGTMGIFSACSSSDGDWPPMKWKTEVKMSEDKEGRYIDVPEEGGTYTFKSINYGDTFWLSQAEEKQNGQSHMYYAGKGDSDEKSWYTLGTIWSDIKRDGANLVVVIQPNKSSERTLNVGVTAGDVFDSFSFRQAAGQ